MKINFKEKKGFTTVDLTLAMLVLILFATILASYMYSVYLSSMEARRTATALNYAVDIFEHIGEISFNSVNAEGFTILAIDSIKGLNVTKRDLTKSEVEAEVGTYVIRLKIRNYKDGSRIKIITLEILYPVSRKQMESGKDAYEKIVLERLKVSEA